MNPPPIMIATIENFSEQGTMIANVLAGGEHRHGVLSDSARTAILDALAELEPSEEQER